jgi:hypothetical protein
MQGARPKSASTASNSVNGTAASEQAPVAAETSGYAIRPIPMNDIEAFRKHTPSIGTHHVAIVMRDGSVRFALLGAELQCSKGTLSNCTSRLRIVQ